MACPDCGSSFGECRIASSVETHGLDCGPYERFEQEYIVCRECGGKFDISDWDGALELSSDLPDPALVPMVSRPGFTQSRLAPSTGSCPMDHAKTSPQARKQE
jgi:hypothetical protein